MKLALHPLCGTTLRNWVRLRRRYGRSPLTWSRVLQITALSTAAAPAVWWERLRRRRRLSQVEVQEPIFVIGHWQSGHTLAQLLLACDPRFATLRLRQAVHPSACLTLRPLLDRLLPSRLPNNRISDDLPISLDASQGDDLALSLLGDVSFYHVWYFPSQAETIFRRAVLMDELADADRTRWQRDYRRLLQKVLMDGKGERVVARNATNTARIRPLLEAFPDARFVYCHRDPYEVFAASLERWRRMTAAMSLERASVPQEVFEESTLRWYVQVQERYLEDRRLIPAGRLVEVSHDELREAPLEVMRHVYDALGLDEFEPARPRMQQLLDGHPWRLAGDKPLSPEQRAAVAERWAFAFDEWGEGGDKS